MLIESGLDSDLARLRRSAVERRWRLLLLFRGEADWCRDAARALLDRSSTGAPASRLWIGPVCNAAPEALSPKKAAGVLGREFADLVFDAHAGFAPDAFGASLGTVRAGGLVVLLAPFDLTDTVYADRRFFRRLLGLLKADPRVVLIDQSGQRRLPGPIDPSVPPPNRALMVSPPCLGEDQAAAVDAVLHVVTGHRRRPLLLIADRGRGKSAAMGIAAARLLAARQVKVLVTAPNRAACQALFDQLVRSDTTTGPRGERLEAAQFVAPDELLRRPRKADLVLVDEAAAIPLPMLAALLRRHARIVFATTVHGYEGSGRGFALRFQRLLDEHSPGWRALRLREPIRYAADDPVEAFGFRALLLDAEPADLDGCDLVALDQVKIVCLDRERLAVDERQLRELFGLLVSAHYRTRPADLAQSLDAAGLRVWASILEGRVVAALLTIDEGGFDAELSAAIARGERRPPGHLLAQTLAAHAGFAAAARCRFARVQRVAVHPALRRRGLGGRLLEVAAADAAERGLDFIGASFGATAGLLHFWRRAGFATVRVGVRRDAASGAHSTVLLRPLRPDVDGLFETLRRRFHQQFDDWLIEPLNDLETDLVLALLGEAPDGSASLSELDCGDLVAFAHGHRDFAAALPALRRLGRLELAGVSDRLNAQEVGALVSRVLQRRREPEVVAELGLPGRAALVELLRGASRRLLELSRHCR